MSSYLGIPMVTIRYGYGDLKSNPHGYSSPGNRRQEPHVANSWLCSWSWHYIFRSKLCV